VGTGPLTREFGKNQMHTTSWRWTLGAALLAAVMAAGSPPASAKGLDFPELATGFNDAAQSIALDPAAQQAVSGIFSRAAVGSVGRRPKAVPPTLSAGFTPSASATRMAREKLADALAGVQPGTSRNVILRELNSGVLQAEFARLLRSRRMTPHDMADVMAGFLVVTWEVASGVDTSALASGYGALRNALRAEMAADPQWKSLNSAQKQETAETMTVLAMLALATRQTLVLHKDDARQKQLRAGVRDAVQAFGIDLDRLRFTEAGFVPAEAS
jgi:hypothetical protein